ncbi:MAG: hypothetical protein NTU52_08460 [Actinobacteria bacterium]|nr:hypothetical protein [Actinomycetota bacterium]
MFTTGSKYCFGIAGLGSLGAVVYMVLVNPCDVGVLALLGIAIAMSLVGGVAQFTGDFDVDSPNDALTANAVAPANSMWPLALALGVVLLLVGMTTNPIVFILGIVVIFAAGVEWALQSWAERASSDSAFNRFVRERALTSLELPLLAGGIVALTAVAFSRIMLAVSPHSGAILFIVIATAVLIVGFGDYFHGFQSVYLLQVLMRCEFCRSQPYIAAAPSASLDTQVQAVTVRRSNLTTILFRNLDDTQYRLVANLGTKKIADTGVEEEIVDCTQMTGKNQTQALILKISKPSASSGPYTLTVPGLEGQEIAVVVP